jgi:hypothetical protein
LERGPICGVGEQDRKKYAQGTSEKGIAVSKEVRLDLNKIFRPERRKGKRPKLTEAIAALSAAALPEIVGMCSSSSSPTVSGT